MSSAADPIVAVILPPREGFGPGRTGALGMIARRLAATPGFRTVVFGGPQAGPIFPGIEFRAMSPSIWWPGNVNLRFVATLARALRQQQPALIEVHNRPEIALALANRFPRIPVTLLLNNDPQDMRAADNPEQRAVLLDRLALVMTASRYLRTRFLEGVNAPEDRVALLYNCIDLAELPPKRRRERLILFAGRIVAEKGPDTFVAACAATLPHLSGWRAEIIGADRFRADSPDTGFVRSVRAAAESATVRMIGYRDHPLVLAAMARAAIVVVPSRWPEPFGLTALEAMASGAALICSARGGLPEVAGDAAVYVDPDSPASVGNAIRSLAQDPSRQAAVAEAGLRRASLFSATVATETLAALRLQEIARYAGR
jgi:UDP-glucose:(glucosyl)LPS alpha-1,2-glucosyltransferase